MSTSNKKALIKEAISRWHRVLMLDKNNELALLSLTENYINLNDSSRASICVNKLGKIKHKGNYVKRNEILAKFYTLKGDATKSIFYWTKVIEKIEKVERIHLKIATQYLSLGDVKRALSHLELASKDVSYHSQVLLIKARCYLQSEDHRAVISLLEGCGESDSASVSVLLFKSYLAIGDNKSILKLIEKVKTKENHLYYFLNGIYQYNCFNYRDAIDSFRLSSNLYNHTESKVWLIKSQNVLESKESVFDSVKRIEKVNKSDLLIQAKCWEAAGQLELAKIRYTASSRKRRDFQSYFALVNFHFNNRNYGKALYAIVLSKKIGIHSGVLDKLEAKIRDGIALTNNSCPSNIIKLSKFDLYINENIFNSIIAKAAKQYNYENFEKQKNPRNISKVALFISSLGPGGAERQVVNLANGLIENQDINDVTLFCTHLDRREQDRFYEKYVHDKVNVHEYYKKREIIDLSSIDELKEYTDFISHIQPFSRQQVILHMAKTLLDFKPDVVHAWLDETFVNAVLVCAMLGIPNVVGRWGSMPPGVNRTISEKDQTNVNYLHYAYSQIGRLKGLKYSSNSKLTGETYASIIDTDVKNVATVYNGIDPRLLEPDNNQIEKIKLDLGIDSNSLVVGTVFRMTEEKRPFLWVDIAERLSNDFDQLHFIIVGSGPLESSLVEYINSKNLENIHLVGKQENVADWYEIFDLVMMTSRVEGVSNVVIESQFCGTPVIAPKVGGLPEAVIDGQTGYLLDQHDIDSFVAIISSVLTDSELRRTLSDNARRYAENKFSIPVMVSNYVDLYRRPLVEYCLPVTGNVDSEIKKINVEAA